jgi:hypothetical protein
MRDGKGGDACRMGLQPRCKTAMQKVERFCGSQPVLAGMAVMADVFGHSAPALFPRPSFLYFFFSREEELQQLPLVGKEAPAQWLRYGSSLVLICQCPPCTATERLSEGRITVAEPVLVVVEGHALDQTG